MICLSDSVTPSTQARVVPGVNTIVPHNAAARAVRYTRFFMVPSFIIGMRRRVDTKRQAEPCWGWDRALQVAVAALFQPRREAGANRPGESAGMERRERVRGPG